MKLIQHLEQRQILAPSLRQALHILQLSTLELQTLMEKELQENPCLEEERPRGSQEKTLPFETVVPPTSHFSASEEDEEIWNYRESLVTKPITLGEHLLHQLRLFCTSEQDCRIGEVLIGSLDENGYLRESVEEIAALHHVSPTDVERLLSLIQGFDPLGVGARDLAECLLLQLDSHSPLESTIIRDHLSDLQAKRVDLIQKKLKVSEEKLKEAVRRIMALEPKPGRSFSHPKTSYVTPDITVKKGKENTFEILLNDEELSPLRLNPTYERLLKGNNLSESDKTFLREKMQSAQFLMRAIRQRKETLQQLAEALVAFQKEFFEQGPSALRPMTMDEMASCIQKHRSTVSRAVKNKFIQTPYGLFEIKFFFTGDMGSLENEGVSSRAVKERIKELIQNENPAAPLSDDEILQKLQEEGISIKRRTVSKYRQTLGFSSSFLRKNRLSR
ncbi:MAG: RNA polymerase factor sigma-54 [Candidatus Omnitrophica bacterium]|nr:RNA polymerase factor sigma-54 [Candidatus Omnitrophota bacterium]